MATQKEAIEKLGSKEELVYWATKGGIKLEYFPDGIYVDDWTVLINKEGSITSVERRLDVPQEL